MEEWHHKDWFRPEISYLFHVGQMINDVKPKFQNQIHLNVNACEWCTYTCDARKLGSNLWPEDRHQLTGATSVVGTRQPLTMAPGIPLQAYPGFSSEVTTDHMHYRDVDPYCRASRMIEMIKGVRRRCLSEKLAALSKDTRTPYMTPWHRSCVAQWTGLAVERFLNPGSCRLPQHVPEVYACCACWQGLLHTRILSKTSLEACRTDDDLL